LSSFDGGPTGRVHGAAKRGGRRLWQNSGHTNLKSEGGDLQIRIFNLAPAAIHLSVKQLDIFAYST
jgi:hypothetical protein